MRAGQAIGHPIAIISQMDTWRNDSTHTRNLFAFWPRKWRKTISRSIVRHHAQTAFNFRFTQIGSHSKKENFCAQSSTPKLLQVLRRQIFKCCARTYPPVLVVFVQMIAKNLCHLMVINIILKFVYYPRPFPVQQFFREFEAFHHHFQAF